MFFTNTANIALLTVQYQDYYTSTYYPTDTIFDDISQSLSGCIFLILVIILGYYGLRVFLKVKKGEIAVCIDIYF